MPIQATALNFYRRRQTFELLSEERPQSLSSVYTVVREVVAAVEERLRNLETSFYGPGGDAASEVRQWVVPLQLVSPHGSALLDVVLNGQIGLKLGQIRNYF